MVNSKPVTITHSLITYSFNIHENHFVNIIFGKRCYEGKKKLKTDGVTVGN